MEHRPVVDAAVRKQALRTQAHAARRSQLDKDAISRRIVARCLSLPEYRPAETVMWYVDVRAEVRTRPALPTALESGKRIVVPWCADGSQLNLFHLMEMDELAPGRYGVLEPRAELQRIPQRCVEPAALDFVIAPGVAFDRRGGRMGHGAGYYDRLFANVRPDALLVGLAFECQLLDAVPMGPYDVFLDRIVTETSVSEGVGRRSTEGKDTTTSVL
ncbi:MAG: 5-formyltetrahydrofolate cyclo-ligase [Planctomycetaceae bacterium]